MKVLSLGGSVKVFFPDEEKQNSDNKQSQSLTISPLKGDRFFIKTIPLLRSV